MINALIITGPSNSGKDTATKMIQERYPHSEVVKFSRPFKSLLEESFGLYPGELDTPAGKLRECPMLGRSYLDILGEAYEKGKNTIFSELWIALSMKKVLEAVQQEKLVIFNDLRNEAELAAIPDFLKVGVIKLLGRGQYLSTDVWARDNLSASNKVEYWYNASNTGSKEDLKEELKQVSFLP